MSFVFIYMARTETNKQGEKRHEREEASFQKAFKAHSKSKALKKAKRSPREDLGEGDLETKHFNIRTR